MVKVTKMPEGWNDLPSSSCGSCGEDVKPTNRHPSMCHSCSEIWHGRRRLAEAAVVESGNMDLLAGDGAHVCVMYLPPGDTDMDPAILERSLASEVGAFLAPLGYSIEVAITKRTDDE